MHTRYDPEGDIFTVFFQDARNARIAGLELNPSVVLYFDTETVQPIEIIFIDYSRLLAAQAAGHDGPLTLLALSNLTAEEQATIIQVLKAAPVRKFLELQPGSPPSIRLNPSKAPRTLQQMPAVT
ncbi:MAG: hypothetical protein ACE5HA_04940 [Anaerolineae bacterium]